MCLISKINPWTIKGNFSNLSFWCRGFSFFPFDISHLENSISHMSWATDVNQAIEEIPLIARTLFVMKLTGSQRLLPARSIIYLFLWFYHFRSKCGTFGVGRLFVFMLEEPSVGDRNQLPTRSENSIAIMMQQPIACFLLVIIGFVAGTLFINLNFEYIA